MTVSDIGMEMNRIKNEETKQNHSFGNNLKKYFAEYCENSGLHGVRYIGERRRLLVEKICWFIALVVALYFCIVLIVSTYHKWENSPVIVTFATKETPIWQIPFPAVTICPETKALPKLFNYTDFLYKKMDGKELTPEDELKLSYIASLCTYHPELTFKLGDFASDDIFEFYDQVSPKFFNSVTDCFYMGERLNCTDIFAPIITDEGLCFSFNLLTREDILSDEVVHYKNYHTINRNKTEWSLETGYDKEADQNAYPKRALYAGALFDFELKLMTLDEDLDFTCGSSIQGYKIQIHHPAMLPRVKQQHFRIPLDQAIIAAMMPTMITTSDAIKAYEPERRKCFFPSERSLRYFKIYTQQNCQIECKTNYTMKLCGCVDFYMPRENGTRICGAPKKECMKKAEDDLLSEGIVNNIRTAKGIPLDNDEYDRVVQKCNCMPECASMTYIIENSQSDWDWERKYKFDRNFHYKPNKSNTHMSYLQVFFKGNQFITSERNELYGPTDFLANFGGLLGLFTGFSMLSLFEILYYLTLRIICNIKMYGSKYWSGKKY